MLCEERMISIVLEVSGKTLSGDPLIPGSAHEFKGGAAPLKSRGAKIGAGAAAVGGLYGLHKGTQWAIKKSEALGKSLKND